MPQLQRVGDVNSAGAPILSAGQEFVYCNGSLVSVVSDPVAGHGLGPHASPSTSGGSGLVFIQGKPVIRAGDPDTCGHTRVGGSPNVYSE